MRLLAFLAALWCSSAWAQARGRLEVHFIDVGQGDSILIRTPAGKAVLIDAGNTEAGPVVDAYLTRAGVGPLDLAIGTHPHLDHIGGMLAVLEHHAPGAYLDPGHAHPLEAYDDLLDWLEARQVPVRNGRAGRTITLEEGITLTLVSPEDPLLKGTRSDANANSVVARLAFGAVSFLLTGDAEAETEARMVRSGLTLASTVLKVAHHGGRYSSGDAFLRAVEPRFAVVSCGQLNGYGHPAPETLNRLQARGVEVLRTDLEGDLVARTDGRVIEWERTGERSAKLDEPGGTRSLSRGIGRARDDHDRPLRAPAGPAALRRPVDLNAATVDELEALPGIGASLAAAIVADRQQRGPFTSVDALERVRGVGRGLVARLGARITAGPPADALSPRPPAPAAGPSAPSETPPAPSPGAAPRPSARPGLAYRGSPAAVAVSPPAAGALLLAPAHHRRLNLNLASADAIAHASGLPIEVAGRIVRHRSAAGPFHRLEEVAEALRLDAAQQRALAAACTVRIDLNHATERDLASLGLTAGEARAILARRGLRPFTAVDDLEEVDELLPERRARLLPLFTVGAGT